MPGHAVLIEYAICFHPCHVSSSSSFQSQTLCMSAVSSKMIGNLRLAACWCSNVHRTWWNRLYTLQCDQGFTCRGVSDTLRMLLAPNLVQSLRRRRVGRCTRQRVLMHPFHKACILVLCSTGVGVVVSGNHRACYPQLCQAVADAIATHPVSHACT